MLSKVLKNDKQLILLGILGGIIGCIGDIMLLYDEDARYETFDYMFMENIDRGRMMIGAYLGVFGIPLEMFGLYVLCKKVSHIVPIMISMSLIIFAMLNGCCYHGICFIIGEIVKLGNDELRILIIKFVDPIVNAMVIPFVIIGIGFGYIILMNKKNVNQIISKRMLIFHPLITYLLCVSIYIIYPKLGRYFIVAGFNFALLVFLVAIYFNFNEKTKF